MAEHLSEMNCPIFNIPAHVEPPDGRDGCTMHSPRAGGKYFITGTAVALVENWSVDLKIKLARWVYEQNQLGLTPEINSDTPKSMEGRRNLSVAQRADALFKIIAEKHLKLGKAIQWVSLGHLTEVFPFEALAATESDFEFSNHVGTTSSAEMEYLFEYLCRDQRLETGDYDYHYITPYGHNLLDGNVTINTKQAFVAMWFNDEVNEAYDKGIKPAIVDAGYNPMRIDNKETNNKIDDEIIAEIKKSKFLIADFTSGFIKDASVSDEDAIQGAKQNKLLSRGGVYYEAGFAQGLGIPVIWTCHADCINHVHFDTRQFNHIVWKTPDELYTRLKHRIEATIT